MKPLKSLRPIIREWFQVLQDYSDRVRGDTPFWYRERPQVGFFAAAAWRKGLAALEEYGMEKGSQRKLARGRNDLWIGGGGKPQWYIETKHAWCDIHKGETKLNEMLVGALEKAMESTRNLKCDCSPRLAAVFVSLVWLDKEKRKRRPVPFDQALDECKKALRAMHEDADAIAYMISSKPSECREGKKKERFVGCALLLKQHS